MAHNIHVHVHLSEGLTLLIGLYSQLVKRVSDSLVTRLVIYIDYTQ